MENELKNVGYTDIHVFLNTKFDDILKLVSNLKDSNTPEKLEKFEKEVDVFIESLFNNKQEIEHLNNLYNIENNKLLNFNPQSIKEIIQSNYPPNIYKQQIYPNIQYFTVSKIIDMQNFINKFNSSEQTK